MYKMVTIPGFHIAMINKKTPRTFGGKLWKPPVRIVRDQTPKILSSASVVEIASHKTDKAPGLAPELIHHHPPYNRRVLVPLRSRLNRHMGHPQRLLIQMPRLPIRL